MHGVINAKLRVVEIFTVDNLSNIADVQIIFDYIFPVFVFENKENMYGSTLHFPLFIN